MALIDKIQNYLVENYHSVKHFLFEGSYESIGVVTLTSIVFDKNFEELIHYVWAVIIFITYMVLKAVLEPVFKDLIAPIMKEWLTRLVKKILK